MYISAPFPTFISITNFEKKIVNRYNDPREILKLCKPHQVITR
jgi:hypothetical protein